MKKNKKEIIDTLKITWNEWDDIRVNRVELSRAWNWTDFDLIATIGRNNEYYNW